MADTKYLILIPDGFADEPLEELGGKTPMEYAKTPNLDKLATQAILGRSHNVPAEFSPGSDVATLSLLGYDPAEVYTGRAPLEAVAQNISMGPNDWAFRCNLVCLENGIMKSFTAGHISGEEAVEILQTLNEVGPSLWNRLASEMDNECQGEIQFYPGVSYRNLMLFRGSSEREANLFKETKTYPPHDYTDQLVEQALPAGPHGEFLRRFMAELAKIMVQHPVNERRRNATGEAVPATDAWLWGQGRRPSVVPFEQRFPGIKGSMITAVDLLRGIARSLGWDLIDVPGITGYVDTDYAAKGRYAAQSLDTHDLVCVHVEATDESGHEGSTEKKVKAIEDIDEKIVPVVLDKLTQFGQWRILVSPDHPTPVRIKTHSRGYVPWLIAGSDIKESRPAQRYNERTAADSPLCYEQGWKLIEFFLNRQS